MEVLNCSKDKDFKVNLEHAFFPIDGSGIVMLQWCSEETSEFPEGDAHLCTDRGRQSLFCHNIFCKYVILSNPKASK
jgi:hypothetical protein